METSIFTDQRCIVPKEVLDSVKASQGVFFEKISKVTSQKIAEDLLNPLKADKQAEVLQRYVDLTGKKVLEIGSGYGVNLIVWSKSFGIEGYGVEPEAQAFSASREISRKLYEINGLDPERISLGEGESLPFPDESFDIVYSTNVLEHVRDPEKVFSEGLRVLKKEGVLQFVFPNYHSYFDGHYAVFHPPVFFHSFFPWYVKNIHGLDPDFADSLMTELNVKYTLKILKRLSAKFDFSLLSLGQEVFLERMLKGNFETWGGLVKIKACRDFVQKMPIFPVLARLLIIFKAWTPIICTLKKE